MSNPWLAVSLADYEGHMRSAEIQQLGALSDLFGDLLVSFRPASIAVLGIAGGNGLEHIDPTFTKRIIGIDVNPLYLDAVRQRYSNVGGLELHHLDLAEQLLSIEPVQLVHVALVFEHAGVTSCLENAVLLTAPGGHLSVVLQLPSEIEPGVGASPFPSIQNLKPRFSLVDALWLCGTLEQRNFRLAREARRSLPGGKAFWWGVFAREETSAPGTPE